MLLTCPFLIFGYSFSKDPVSISSVDKSLPSSHNTHKIWKGYKQRKSLYAFVTFPFFTTKLKQTINSILCTESKVEWMCLIHHTLTTVKKAKPIFPHNCASVLSPSLATDTLCTWHWLSEQRIFIHATNTASIKDLDLRHKIKRNRGISFGFRKKSKYKL